MLRTNLDKTKPFANTSHNKWHKLFWLAIVMMLLTPRAAFATLVNNGVDGTIGWDAIISNGNIAGAITGQTPGGLISVTNHLSSGFDIYAKNNSDPSSQNFTMRNQMMGIAGATSAPFVRIGAANGYTPEWLELRANQGIFDLTTIKVASGDAITATSYNFTLQALDSSFSPAGAAVTLNSVPFNNYGTFSVSGNTDFDGIYGVRITVNTGLQIAVDDIEITSPRMPDTTPPTVTSVTSSTSDGTYKVGDPISIQVNFSENVIVASGTPQLTLETGTTDRTINYTGGTNSSTLTFTYTVQAGDTSADLDYTTINALTLSGSTIRDAAGNNAILTLAAPGAANSLGNNKALVIDGVVPTVTSVNSVTANGTYKIGDVISVQVNFSEAVTVTGTPQLTLETGATDRTISYATSTGPSTLSFSYTVQAGDNSNDLDYVATTSLALGGGTIRDDAANNATLTLATPGQPGSLGANKNFVIDGVVPSVTSTAPAGGALSTDTSVNFTVNFSESVSNISTDDFALGVTGSATGTIASVSASSGTTVDVTVSGINGNGTIKLNVNASTNIADAAGNSGLAAYTSGTTHTVAIPLLTITISTDKTALKATETATLTFTLSESSTNFILGDITATGGVVSNLSGSGTSYTATFTPTANSTTGATVDVAGGAFTNAAGNGNTVATQLTMTVDTIVPTVTIGSNKTALKAGDTATLTFTLSESSTNFILEDIIVTGGLVSNLSGSGTSYTATFTPTANSTTGATVNVAGGTFTDAAGNTNTAATPLSMTVETTVPTVVISTDKPALKAGDTATLTFTLSESSANFEFGDVVVTGGSLSALTGSGSVYTATFTPTAGSTTAATVNVAGSTFTDAAGNNNTAATQLSMTVDTIVPTVVITSDKPALKAGDTATLTFTLSESSVNFEFGDVVVTGGSLSALTGSGSVYTATFTPTAGSTTAATVNVAGSTFTDAAGNTNTAATQLSMTVDTTVPTVVITSDKPALKAGDTATLTFTLSESSVNFEFGDVVVTGGSLSALTGSGSVYTATFTPTAGSTTAATVNVAGGTFTDAAGNTNTAATQLSMTVDTEIPNAPLALDLATASDSGASSTDNITNSTTPTFTGTAEPNSTVEVFVGAVSKGTVVVNGAGVWSLTVAGGSALTEGTYNITATVTDAAGNTSAPSAALAVTIDTTAPVKPAAPNLTDASDTGSSNSDNLTNATSLVFNGAAEDGSTVSLSSSLNNALGTATATGGNWTLTTAAVTSEGAHNITLTAADLAGNISVASDPLAITLDKTAPAIGGVAFDQASVTSANQTALSFTLTGAEVGATAQYDISSSNGGAAVTNTFTVVSAGQQVTGLNVSGLNDGLLTASLTLTDAAGNSNNPAVTATVNKDANVPVINAVAINSGNYKAGDTISFGLTFSEALVLSGATTDYSLAIDIGGTTRQALLTTNAAGVLTFSYTVQAGENTAGAGVAIASNGLSLLNNATIKDAGNNDATLNFNSINNSAAKVDTTAPVISVVTDPAQAVFVNAANYQIKGTHSEIGLTINLYTDAGNDGTADGGVLASAVVDADGNWSLLQPLTADTAHNYVVVAEDAAGNISAAIDVPTITEDSIAPVAAVITSPAAALAVNTVNQVISGTHAEDGVTVELFADADNDGVADNGTVLANAVVGSVATGTWSLTAPLTQNVANNFVVVVKDKAGNVSTVSDVPTITQDSVAPVVAVTTLVTADSTPALAGTVNDNTATLSLVVNGQTYVPTNSGNGNWALADNQISALTDGVYDVAVSATDAQGNIGTDASVNELTIDLLPPSGYSVAIQQSRIDAANQNAMSFVFAGAEVGSTYTYVISDGTNSVTGTAVVTAANQQIGSINVTGLAEGTLQLSVSLTDTVGNTGAAATATVVKLYNATPVISGTAATSVNEDSPYSFTPAATDADTGTTFTFSISNKPVWATFNTATGALSGTPGNEHVGTTSGIVISVSDGTATASLPAFAITVVNTNDAPVVSSAAVTVATQGAAYSYSFAGTDVDVGDTLTRSVVTKPVWLNFNAGTGVLSGTPGSGDVGTHAVTLRVTDAAGLFADQSFNVIVANINDAPTIAGSPAVTVAQGAVYSFIPTAADVDTGTTLTFSIANKPSWATFNTATGALSGTPTNVDVGATAGIVISVSDGELSAALPAFTLTVTNTNDAPTITGSPAVTVAQGAVYSFIPTAADVDTGTTLTFSIANKPSWATFNTATGALSGTPANVDVGATAGIVISVSDGELSAALPAFTLTVTNTNDAPTITGSPAVTVAQGAVYSFIPTAADVDTGTTLTFSIANKPTWATFNTATGALSGTPANTDVGATAGIVISVSDGELSAALPAFTLTVTNTNDAPTTIDRSATLEEDSSLSVTLTAQDPDQDRLTFEIVTQPEHGTATLLGAVLIYTPEPDFNGTDSIGFIAKDAELSSNVATLSLTVTAVNDHPVVEDDSFNLQRTTNNQYLLNVLANDSDVDGDTLVIDGASSSVGTVSFNAQGLTLTAPDRYVGPVSLRYTVTDGNGGRASADVSLIIEGGAAADLPVITVPADIEVNATALFTRVPIGTATAVDRNGRRLRVSLINGSLFFAPGKHIVYWQATDADGNTATKAQKVSVNPLISLSKDQLVTEGSDVTVEVILNGPAPVYPVLVPYTVSGRADGNDHTLVSGVAEISSGLSTSIRFTVLDDGQTEGTEDIVISLDASVNRGSQRTSRIVVTEANIAPVVALDVLQNGESRLTVSESGGVVNVTATITDANVQDQVTGVWSFGRLDNVTSDQTQLSFDPAEQGPGLYLVSYTATDSGTPNLSTTARAFIVIRPNLPTLGTQDSDGDLVPDDQEGFADSDGDGIPDYMDAINECNVMPTELLGQTEFVAEGDPGVCLRLGTVAAETDAGGLQIAKDAIDTDNVAVNIGGIFDFIAYGLPEQGQSYSLVIPQRLPVPANAVYRKFNDTGWVDFVSNERNSIASTQGERGFCPPPGGTEWTEGLTEGHWCVQVTVEDGGPNDADGIANNTIVDPGGVAVELNGNNLPVAVADVASTRVDTPVDVNVLANDTDPDGDSLTVNQAIGSFGTVTILADQQLSYTPNPDFIGTDTVIYNITDGKGGTASSELVISVSGNSSPVAVNDVASTDDKTVVLIAVLANDSDEDGNTLMVSSASAVQGTVSIEADQRLRYTPKVGFDGVDTISYRITDGVGGEATAQVSVTVRAYQPVVVDNKSSGGSMTMWMVIVLAGAVVLRRRSMLAVAAAVLLSFSPFSQGADWYLQASAGQSNADQKQSRLVEQLPDGTITGFDDSDSSYGFTLGYQVHPYVALEAGYLDLGEASSQISAESLTPQQYHEVVKAVSPVLVDGFTAAVRFSLWQNEQWNLEVPLGVLFWDSEIESRMDDTVLKSETDGTDIYLGVQLNYQLAAGWKVGVGYQQLNLKPNDVNSWLVSLRYEF